jgi:Icc-related predicted phosphoesterase
MMKIVAISDTHCRHRDLRLPEADMIIHAGDICQNGTEGEVLSFLNWFTKLDFRYKIFIAGNHDFFFDGETDNYLSKIIPSNITYLNDSGIEIEGFTIWGSPVTPWLYDGAFNRIRGRNISKHWKMIPENTDILITHGPPYGILDKNRVGFSAGCQSLKRAVKRIQPKLHVFGHIHEAGGIVELQGITFVNACVYADESMMKSRELYSITINREVKNDRKVSNKTNKSK